MIETETIAEKRRHGVAMGCSDEIQYVTVIT